MQEQVSLFDGRRYKGTAPQKHVIEPPSAEQTVLTTLPAYHAYLSSGRYAPTTPDNYIADVRRFAGFTSGRPLASLTRADIQQWIAQLKRTMPPKTVNRKVSALGNYFRWLETEQVLERNPGATLRAQRVRAPLPEVLNETECQRLLEVASRNPRTYVLVLLLLETGLKKAELLGLSVNDFDFSNQYQPELWLRHEQRQAYKDRKLSLPPALSLAYQDYVGAAGLSYRLFPCTGRQLERWLRQVGHEAGLTKRVTPSILRDTFVVRSVRQGQRLEGAFQKLGLSPLGYDDARRKYHKLIARPL